MGAHLDTVPFSGIIRVRDLMYSVKDPFRLDQGDVSFDAPDTVKSAMARALEANHTHYLPTTGVPKLRELIAEKLRRKNGLPIASPEEIYITQGGIHAMYVACQALLEPGDEVIAPDPTWPPVMSNVLAAHGVPVRVPVHEHLGWRFDLDELRRAISARTKAIYINSPHNPTGGVFTRADLEGIATLAKERGLWILADESYEDVIFGETPHVSIASIEDAHARTISLYTFSKSYSMTGLRLGYLAVQDAKLQERVRKVIFMTLSNVSSVVQYGGIGALEGSQQCIEDFRHELEARRNLFYAGVAAASGGMLYGERPHGAFYAFLRIDASWRARPECHPKGVPSSRSWALVEELITRGRIGCVPGVDFGAHGEDHIRFCFARGRQELTGALESMRTVFGE